MIAYGLIVVLAYLATRATSTIGDVLVVVSALALIASFWTLKQIAITATVLLAKAQKGGEWS